MIRMATKDTLPRFLRIIFSCWGANLIIKAEVYQVKMLVLVLSLQELLHRNNFVQHTLYEVIRNPLQQTMLCQSVLSGTCCPSLVVKPLSVVAKVKDATATSLSRYLTSGSLPTFPTKIALLTDGRAVVEFGKVSLKC